MLSLAYLETQLPRAIRTKRGQRLATVADVQEYMLALPNETAGTPHWQRTAQALLDHAEPLTVEKETRLCLFLSGDLVLG